MTRRTVGVAGARGHVGAELIKLIARHPSLELAFVGSRELAGQRVGDHVAELDGDLRYENLDAEAIAARNADAVILALPNDKAAPYIEAVDRQSPLSVIVDVSSDYRFDRAWY